MRPGMSNVLVVVTGSDFLVALDLEQAMAQLKERAEKKEETLYGRYSFEKPADFFKYYLRLSGILVRTNTRQGGKFPSVLWINNQAKHSLVVPRRTLLRSA